MQTLAKNDSRQSELAASLKKQLRALEGRIEGILEAIQLKSGATATLTQKLDQLELDRDKLLEQLKKLEESSTVTTTAISKDQLEKRIPEVLESLSATSFEFSDLMRKLIPEFVFYPVQAIDCPLVRSRAKMVIAWARMKDQDQNTNSGLNAEDFDSITVDLFEMPQHIRDAMALRAAGNDGGLRSPVTKQLGMSRERALRARRYLEAMKNAGMMDPYIELKGKPATASRWRRGNRKPQAEGA